MRSKTVINFGIFFFLVIVAFVYVTYFQNDITYEQPKNPNIQLNDEPYQRKIRKRIPFIFKGVTIIPLADFKIKAKVLSRHRYRRGKITKISPVDLALGWGKMADDNILKDIKIWQRGRWYYWKTNKFPIPRREIETHSANMHIIPANDDLRKILLKIKKGDIISIEGHLVEVQGKNWFWKSSLTRKDTGGGSCEVIFAKKIEILTN